jgi:2-C-methyl-D-erythritol 4-phosphate cytidylyltransferase
MNCSAIIVAAGSSRRMGFNKLLAPLRGQPVIVHTVQAFIDCSSVSEIIVVAEGEVAELVAGMPKVKAAIPGGAERHLSVWAGLQLLSATSDIVAVHDGGRPLIHPEQIQRCILAAQEQQAVACARPITETLKRCDAQGRILDSIDRTHAWIMETPQVFQHELLLRAYRHVIEHSLLVTDEVSAVQALGHPVHTVVNDHPNGKITYPSDLQLAEKWLLLREK